MTEVSEAEEDTVKKEKIKGKSSAVPHKSWEEEDVILIDDDDDDCNLQVLKQDIKACNKQPGKCIILYQLC